MIMKIDGTKIAEAIKAEIGEMVHGVHDGVAFAIGKTEVRKGIFAQVQIKITIDNAELLAEPVWSLRCVEDLAP
jgi:hypothetical protein